MGEKAYVQLDLQLDNIDSNFMFKTGFINFLMTT
jgi:hypothetical protein